MAKVDLRTFICTKGKYPRKQSIVSFEVESLNNLIGRIRQAGRQAGREARVRVK